MANLVPVKVQVGLPVAKGLVMTSVLAAMDISFIKSLVIATVSASVSGLFLLVSTRWYLKEARERTEPIAKDVKVVKEKVVSRQAEHRKEDR